MKVLLIGPPASGKGTIGKMISDLYGIPLISGGALLRALPKSHPKYEEINTLMEKGEPAPKDLLGELHRERITHSDCANGFILDGWGRNMIDLAIFDPGFNVVVVFNIARETALKRITGRRICDTDGKIYNIYTLPAEELAQCTGNLIQREDDSEEVVNHRLDLYEADTLPVVEHLKNNYTVITLDAEGSPQEIFEDLQKELKKLND